MTLDALPPLDVPLKVLFIGDYKFDSQEYSIRTALRLPVYGMTHLVTLEVLRRLVL